MSLNCYAGDRRSAAREPEVAHPQVQRLTEVGGETSSSLEGGGHALTTGFEERRGIQTL